MHPTTQNPPASCRDILLEVPSGDGVIHHSIKAYAIDEAQALAWALANWWPARSSQRINGPGYYLNPRLIVDGEPVAEVLARITGGASARAEAHHEIPARISVKNTARGRGWQVPQGSNLPYIREWRSLQADCLDWGMDVPQLGFLAAGLMLGIALGMIAGGWLVAL